MKKKSKLGKTFTFIGIAVLCGGLLWILSLFMGYSSRVTTDDAQVEQYISPINVKVPGYISEIQGRRIKKRCSSKVMTNMLRPIQL